MSGTEQSSRLSPAASLGATLILNRLQSDFTLNGLESQPEDLACPWTPPPTGVRARAMPPDVRAKAIILMACNEYRGRRMRNFHINYIKQYIVQPESSCQASGTVVGLCRKPDHLIPRQVVCD
jgi:hypothetical protein